MTDRQTRWVLAFDASCGTCRQIARAVADTVEDRLDVLPLADLEVRGWREQVFGPQPPSVPTLLRIQGTNVRGWTGAGMGLRLFRHLGPKATLRVLQTFGQLSRAAGPPTERHSAAGIGRAHFLRLGAGAAIAAGLVLTGRAPAFAGQGTDAAQAWAEANRHRLPQTYDALAEYSMVYRRAIYHELSSQVKSRLWVEHISRYRDAHPGLSAQQRRVIDDAIEMMGRPAFFDSKHEFRAEVDGLKRAAVRAFRQDEAATIFATLGPSRSASSSGGCTCCIQDDWCNWGQTCADGDCNDSVDGCGWGWNWPCNGLCYD